MSETEKEPPRFTVRFVGGQFNGTRLFTGLGEEGVFPEIWSTYVRTSYSPIAKAVIYIEETEYVRRLRGRN